MADQHPQEDAPMTNVDVVQASKPLKEEESTLTEEHHQHHSSSSSLQSDDAEEVGEKKKKKKKGFKEKIKEKISHEKEEPNGHKDGSLPLEKCDEMAKEESTNPEEKKGFLEKLKENLPGQHKKVEEADHATPTECGPDKHSPEKKGILEKIKEKLPGSHKNGEGQGEIRWKHIRGLVLRILTVLFAC